VTFGRRAPLALSRAPFAASSCSAPLGRRALLSSSCAPVAASSCSASLGRRASLTSSRPLCAASSFSASLGPSWTPPAAHFEPRALCSLELLGVLLDAARRGLTLNQRLPRSGLETPGPSPVIATLSPSSPATVVLTRGLTQISRPIAGDCCRLCEQSSHCLLQWPQIFRPIASNCCRLC